MGSGGVAIAALPTVICLKVSFSDGLMGGPVRFIKTHPEAQPYLNKLGFGKGYELLYCIGFGYPDESPEAKPRDSSKVKFVE